MNKEQHLTIGTISFSIFILAIYQIREVDTQFLVLGFLGLLLGSVIPDIIEPPTSWKHRGFYHSKRILKQLIPICIIISIIAIFLQFMLIISSFLLGYVVHLLADSTTEIGLME